MVAPGAGIKTVHPAVVAGRRAAPAPLLESCREKINQR
jgi:hypothetical protein